MTGQRKYDSTKLITGKIEPLEDFSRSTLSHVSSYIESYQVTGHNAFGCRKLDTALLRQLNVSG